MAKPRASLKSSLRKSVINAYRARGRRQSNLWLVYSAKTDADWMLSSDRKLVHWLYFLEANPEVRSFDLAPEPIAINGSDDKMLEFDALVTLQNGKREWHDVRTANLSSDPAHALGMTEKSVEAAKAHAAYKVFDDAVLRPKAKIALRWFKAISFAAAIRGQEHIPCRTALVAAMRNNGHGNVQTLLMELDGVDQAIIHGMLVRLAISGAVHLDLEKTTYGKLTRWTYHGA